MISWKLLRAAIEAPRWMFEFELLILAYLAGNMPAGSKALEIGSWCGSSSLALLAGLTQNRGHLDCVDTWDGNDKAYLDGVTGPIVERSFRARIGPSEKVGLVSIHKGDYRDVLPRLPLRSYGLIFVDGPHEEEHTDPTIDLCLPLLTNDGTIVFHDAATAGWPGVLGMVKRIAETNQFEKPRLIETMAIFRRSADDKAGVHSETWRHILCDPDRQDKP